MDPMANPASFEAMRDAMVASQLRTNAVNDPRVVTVMAQVPRERFVPEAVRAIAYRDTPLRLDGGRVQNTPLATGRLIVEAGIGAGDRVLLIGSAGGYTAAILSRLAHSVVALEEDAALVSGARAALAGYSNVELVEGPLSAGWAAGGPYDAIVIDGAVEQVPAAIVDQVRLGGHVVTGIVDRGVTRLAAGERTAGGFGLYEFADIDCVILPGFARPAAFTF